MVVRQTSRVQRSWVGRPHGWGGTMSHIVYVADNRMANGICGWLRDCCVLDAALVERPDLPKCPKCRRAWLERGLESTAA